jgi:menaquinone-dependent protoporphyrinogen IX oxidase
VDVVTEEWAENIHWFLMNNLAGDEPMKKNLVAYATNGGSTAEVAQAVGEELGRDGDQVEVRLIKDVATVENYDAVVVGAAMIMGWHLSAVNFVKKHQQVLSRLKTAYFFTAMRLTQVEHQNFGEISIFVDPQLAKPPQNTNRLSFKERYATVDSYLPTALKAAPLVKPVSVGFFGGKLDLFRLSWWQRLFVLIVIQAQPGDYRNWSYIREWASKLGTIL